MQNAVFNITERTEKGKKVRMKGEVPAIMYGQSLEKPIPCQITKRELIDLLASDSSVLSLKLNDKVVGTQEFEKKTTDAGYTYQTVKGKSGHTSMYMTFDVPYEEGTLEAVAYNEKGEVIEKTCCECIVSIFFNLIIP